MQVTISVTVNGPEDLAKLSALIDSIGGAPAITNVANEAAAAEAPTKSKRGKKAAAEAEETFELNEDDAPAYVEDEEANDAEEDDEEETAPEHTLQDVIKALGAYAKKHGAPGREKAIKILAKHGAKNVNKLDPKHYAAVIKAVSGK